MAILKCKMCGGDIELAADKTFGTCEFCGCTMTFPKVDDEQRAAAFNRGNHFRRIGEFDKALAVYERIVREDEADAEAHWCCALCRFGIEYVEDPSTYEWMPTCHRVSFDSFLEDVDYLAAVEHSDGITRRQYQKDAAKIAEVQRGILATSQNTEPYDVFICYKESDANGDRTRDSLLAQDIYYQLTEQGRKVFFARITLEDVAGAQYEPYIFAALNSAKVMIVVGTKPEHLNAVWVKNEWSRFLAMMKKDRHKLLLPCYRDMDPYDMPEALSVLQSYDMSKIGFIQDLTRGIAKVLDAEKKPEPVKETVVMQQNVGGNSANVVALLKRGYMALEDDEWDRADNFFEEVLNQNAECFAAYFGKFLAQQRVSSFEEYVTTCIAKVENCTSEPVEAFAEDKAAIDKVIEKYACEFLPENNIRTLFTFDRTIQSKARKRRALAEENSTNLRANKLYSRAMQYASQDDRIAANLQMDRLENKTAALIAEAMEEERNSANCKRKEYEAFLVHAEQLADEYCSKELRKHPVYEKAIKIGEEYKNNTFYSLELRIKMLKESVKTLESMGSVADAQAKASEYRAIVAKLDKENNALSGGCYVATCVYGSYNCPQVWTLRRYRDEVLATTWGGRVFIRTYYALSPTVVRVFGGVRWIKKLWQKILDKMISRLHNSGFADTPYEDRPW